MLQSAKLSLQKLDFKCQIVILLVALTPIEQNMKCNGYGYSTCYPGEGNLDRALPINAQHIAQY